ncbi:MAG: metal ABC transporter substrate-binding protein [bacterium]|nr:metal ABC transporter substrate-binding protein [bacterium]
MKNQYIICVLIILILLIVGFPAYFFLSKGDVGNINSYKKNIAVTIFPIYDITKNIAGDKLNVNLILPVGTSAHTFDPKPSDIALLEHSVVVIKVGTGLDDWVEKIVPRKVTRVDLTSSVNLLKSTEVEYDPHYWLSVDNALLIANKVKNELVKIDPENSEYYENNLLKYKEELLDLQKYIESELIDQKGKGIITFHDAFIYFAIENELEILTTIEPFAGKEPTPKYLSEVEDIIRVKKVKVLFKEPQLSSGLLNGLANDLGITILTIDPLGGGKETNSYIKMMKFNTNEIKKGLEL